MKRALFVLLFAARAAAADEPARPIVLRMATVAPDGTAWAREMRAFSSQLEAATHGQVRVKWYMGGIAGDEMQILDRMRRDQLDGTASGGMLCSRIAASMRVLEIVGLFQDRNEAAYVAGRLKPTLDAEFARAGLVNLAELDVGPHVLFLRQPVQSLAELRKTRLWVWDLDDVLRLELSSIGVPMVPAPVDQAAHAYDESRLDGFVSTPSAALAFQWSTQARYLVPLRINVLNGCLLVSARAFDSLPLEAQRELRAAGARGAAHLDEIGRSTDEALLGGLFSHHGLKYLAVSARFRSEFFEAAQAARDRLGAQLAPPSLLLQVASWLADYRAEHPTTETDR